MLQFTPAVPTSGKELSVENLCDSAQQQAVLRYPFYFSDLGQCTGTALVSSCE